MLSMPILDYLLSEINPSLDFLCEKNKLYIVEDSINWVLFYYSPNTKTSVELGETETPNVDDVIWPPEHSCAWD